MIGYFAAGLSKGQKILVDGGYTGANFANSVKLLIGTNVEAVRNNELHKSTVLAKHRIAERSFGRF